MKQYTHGIESIIRPIKELKKKIISAGYCLQKIINKSNKFTELLYTT